MKATQFEQLKQLPGMDGLVSSVELTSARQLDRLIEFITRNPGRGVRVIRRHGDPRSARRWIAAQVRRGAIMEAIGRSSGCASSRDNYHTTIAMVDDGRVG
jgi:orotidine-5'-phosphate decarboxylase